MADEDQPGGATVTAERAQQAPTQYVVLQRIDVKADDYEKVDLPPSSPPEFAAWVPFLSVSGSPMIYEARSNREACRAATRLPDDENRYRPGSYKAVPLRSWKGGITFRDESRTVTVTDELED